MTRLMEPKAEATSPEGHRQSRFYLPELDGLRFYAFLGVFICHTLPLQEDFYRGHHLPMSWLWVGAVRSGTCGVDLFFALSAFLITSLLLRERKATGRVSVRMFYIRRILRIWPLYFLVVGLGVFLAHPITRLGFHPYSDQKLPWVYVIGLVLFVSNWIVAILGTVPSICSPLWTVSIEEQFYLLWPMLVRALRGRDVTLAATITLLVAILSQVGVVLLGGRGGFIYYGSASRFASLAVGILLAANIGRMPRLTASMRLLLVAFGLVGWVLSSARLTDYPGPLSMRMVFGRLIISLSSGAILYGCLYSTSVLVRGTWVVRLGKISYGLYLWHFTGLLIAVSLLHPVHGIRVVAGVGLGFLLTLLLAAVSYHWVELPFLRLKERFSTVLSRPS